LAPPSHLLVRLVRRLYEALESLGQAGEGKSLALEGGRQRLVQNGFPALFLLQVLVSAVLPDSAGDLLWGRREREGV
jgi:hypothetical protein